MASSVNGFLSRSCWGHLKAHGCGVGGGVGLDLFQVGDGDGLQVGGDQSEDGGGT